MCAAGEPRANHIVKNRKSQRGARPENSFLCYAKHDLKSFRTAIELRGKKFLAIQQVEDSVDDAQRAPELAGASRQRGALLANFLEADRNVGGVSSLIELDPNIFFLDWLKVAASCQAQQADFECVLIDWTALAQENFAANVAVAKFVQAKKFDSLHAIRRGVTQIEGNARSVIFRVESSHHVHGMGRKAIKLGILGSNPRRPRPSQFFYLLLGISIPSVCSENRDGLATLLLRDLPECVGQCHGSEPIIRTRLDRNRYGKALLRRLMRPRKPMP